MNYTEIKKQALERYFSRTNEKQREAIFKVKGSVLIIAGAGSGKTTVLCNRIANMLLFGNAYNSDYIPAASENDMQFLCDFAEGKIGADKGSTERLSSIVSTEAPPAWKILAVTFTNKAAAELKERIAKMNAPSEDVWASTFHSACVKILRRGIEGLGYQKSFTIYDSDDSQRVIKDVLKQFAMSDKTFNPRDMASAISRAKDKLITPDEFKTTGIGGKSDFRLQAIKDVYTEYQKRLKAANALDFDDIIMKTVELFETDGDTLRYWQNHFDYIMVDEYQDTNIAQFRLISLLAGGSGNLCVVGDEDQSIYRFRGATIENILSFEKQFNSTVIKLEQNYRSTSTILDAANAVINNNTQRKSKTLWSDLGEGEKITLKRFDDEQGEARFVSEEIMHGREKQKSFADYVILYRTNAQSRTFELSLSKSGIPYKIIGGTRFYDRKEIKDIVAYMSVINNPFDTVRLMRIINEPKRGLGDATQAEIAAISAGTGLSPIEVMERAEEFASITKKSKPLTAFARMINDLIGEERDLTLLVDDILELTGYKEMLSSQGDEGEGRLQNIEELKSSIITFCNENEDAGLSEFLEQVALISDLDNYQSDEEKVTLMTMHAAKGLEFDTVFLVGAEEGLFPSRRSLLDSADMEEERRLAYVAITRAKKNLFITATKQRLLYGQTTRNNVSRFVQEIPNDLLSIAQEISNIENITKLKKKYGSGYLQSQSKKAAPMQQNNEVFKSGDRVSHKVFGEGTVLNATPSGGDTLLEIAFDKVGTKKIMSNFAKVTKL